MKEYEISNNDKTIGKIKLFNNNISKNLEDALIKSNEGYSYKFLNNEEIQTYEVAVVVNDVDELYDIVSKYKKDNIFETIDEIKKYNNIKTIKKNTEIKIIIPELYLSSFNVSKDNIDLTSLFLSKIHFIKNVLKIKEFGNINNELNNIIINYNNYINSSEYEFLTDDEIKNNILDYINKVNILIKNIEVNTNYKYSKNYIIPIKLCN